jgi:hypothetical protein
VYFKSFAYSHDCELALDFIQWWIMSRNFSKDIKKGEQVRGGKSVRDIDHTILITQDDQVMLIEKSAIMSDGPQRSLRSAEIYLNKPTLKNNGLKESVKMISRWLKSNANLDPFTINPQKAQKESQKFDMVGIGFFMETDGFINWKLKVIADVVGIPK